MVLMEIKGSRLARSSDTNCKHVLCCCLSNVFVDERALFIGELVFDDIESQSVSCELIFEQACRGPLDQRYFGSAQV